MRVIWSAFCLVSDARKNWNYSEKSGVKSFRIWTNSATDPVVHCDYYSRQNGVLDLHTTPNAIIILQLSGNSNFHILSLTTQISNTILVPI
jgi:hypothetical protein